MDGVASAKGTRETARSKPQTQACTWHVRRGPMWPEQSGGEGQDQRGNPAQVKEGHLVGTSQSTLSDSQPWTHLFLVRGRPSHGEFLWSPFTLPRPS